MNKKLTVAFIITITIVILMSISGKGKGNLVSPNLNRVVSDNLNQTPVSSVVPKTFKFDKTTDLKKELESINPVVLESDF